MNLEDLNKEIEKFQKISNREYLPLYAQGKLDAYLELLPLVKKLTLTDVSQQRGLLIAFAKYMEENKMYARHDKANVDDFLDNHSN